MQTTLQLSGTPIHVPEGSQVVLSTVYQCWNSNEDGRRTELINCLATPEAAKNFSHKKGSWGGDLKIEPVPAIIIDGKAYCLMQEAPIPVVENQLTYEAELKANVLNNLSDEEKRVIGLE